MPPDADHRNVLVAGATGRPAVLVEILLARGHSGVRDEPAPRPSQAIPSRE